MDGSKILITGHKYTTNKLKFLGFNVHPSQHLGYLVENYFDDNGVYLGPDDYGIEPLFDHITAIEASTSIFAAKYHAGPSATAAFNSLKAMGHV